MHHPFFSIIISTYNRKDAVSRCLASCMRQTFSDFEVVVVDDASTDETVQYLGAISDSRLKIVVHDFNRGINPSRYTGVINSNGEWCVVVDSDWELFPSCLKRHHEIIGSLPKGIRVLRSRLLWDDGHISPAFIPNNPVGYRDRILWVEQEGGDDAGRCLHRSVFANTPYFSDRRGAMEALYELNLARNELSLFVEDVLGKEYTDAPNSYLRSLDMQEVVPRLFREATDMLWMAETTLADHGDALERYGPRQYHDFLRIAAFYAFLAGNRAKGLHYARKGLGQDWAWPMLWMTLILGLLGPRLLAYGAVLFRRLKATFNRRVRVGDLTRRDESAAA